MKKLFGVGETVTGYSVPVLNEREVRASAGILFAGALIAAMHVWLLGDMTLVRLFIVLFGIEFFIRVCINPRFAPALVLGRLATRGQIPEYVGAPQKRYAWGLGLLLASIMFVLVILLGVTGPIPLLICGLCLVFLFFESAFGICLGCKLYNLVHTNTSAQHCPGGTCSVSAVAPIQYIYASELLVLATVAAGMIVLASTAALATFSSPAAPDCTIPDWVQAIGHEELYVLHHGCAKNK